MFKNSIKLTTTLAVALAIGLFSLAPLQAATLTGSGAHLPIPVPNPGDPGGVSLVSVAWSGGGGFDGTWSVPAHPDWIGTVPATGPIPASMSTGITTYDFTALPTGMLPAGTYFVVGDVDGGSTLSEKIDFTAYDTAGNEIDEWLDEPIGIWGISTTGGSPVPNDIPSWDWNNITSKTYRIDGATVTGGNPSMNEAMVSNQPIASLVVNKHTTHFGFRMRAPETVPEPSAIVLLGLGVSCLVAIRRQRNA